APGIPDALPQRERPRIPVARGGEVAPISSGTRQRPDGIGLDANVPDRCGEGARALEIRTRAVEPTLPQEAGADVAQHRGDPGGIVDRPGASEGAAPDCD